MHPEETGVLAAALTNRGTCLDELGRPSEALSLHKEALDLKRRIHGEVHPDVATSFGNLSVCLELLGRTSEAIVHAEKALRIREAIFGPRAPDVAESLTNLANCYETKARYAEALALHERAMAIVTWNPDVRDAVRATVLNNHACCLAKMGYAAEAIPALRAAGEAFRAIHPGDHLSQAIALNNVAILMSEVGAHAEALETFQEALAIEGRSAGQESVNTATTRGNIGAVLVELGRAAEAEVELRAALETQCKELLVAKTLANLGDCLRVQDQRDAARQTFEEALGVLERLESREGEDAAAIVGKLARMDLDEKRLESAELRFRESIEIFELLRSRSADLGEFDRGAYFARIKASGDPYHGMVLTQIALGRPGAALSYVERARGRGLLDLLERGGLDLLEEAERRARSAGQEDQLDEIKRCREEIGVAEVEVARLVAQMARLRSSDTTANAAEEALRAANERLRRSRRAAARLVRGSLARPASPGELRGLLAPGERLLAYSVGDELVHAFVLTPEAEEPHVIEIEVRHGKLEELVNDYLRVVSHGRLGEAARGVTALPAATPVDLGAGKTLGDLLLPAALRERLKGTSRVYVLPDGPLHSLPLEALIVGSDNEGRPVYWLDEGPPIAYAPSGSVLRWTLERSSSTAAVEPTLDLVAVADPSFAKQTEPVLERGALVLEVLPDAEGQRVGIRALDVIVAYGGRAVGDDEELAAAIEALSPGPLDAPTSEELPLVVRRDGKELAFYVRPGALGIALSRTSALGGWPRPASAAYPGAGAAARPGFGQLDPLPGARDEVKALAGLFDKERVKVLLGPEARERRVFELAPSTRRLHFATHGLASELAGASFSALALAAPDDTTSEDDGFLRLEELLGQWGGRLRACTLVVLSACRTQVGPQQIDEAVMALPVGFLHAGAPAVVATLWDVDDASTAELMANFYTRELSDSADSLEALAAARRALRTKWADPYYWAPFIFLGSPR